MDEVINLKGAHDHTVLRDASRARWPAMVSFLLENKADPSIRDDEGKTALQLACELNFADVVDAILSASASAQHSSKKWIDNRDEDGCTALITAIEKHSRYMVSNLIAAGADVQIADINGKTPLQYAKSRAVARMLLEAGAKDIKDESGYTLLMHACERADSLWIQLLSDPKYGCNVNAVNNGESLALIILARRRFSYFTALQTLISSFPSLNLDIPDASGCTALHIAAEYRHGHADSVKLLLDAGADADLGNMYGDVPLTNAEDAETVRLLIEAAPWTVYHRHDDDRTMLMQFCSGDLPIETIEQFLSTANENNVPVDVNDVDDCGDTALDMAMLSRNTKSVDLLLVKGADVMHSGWEGTTVLMKPFLDRDDETVDARFADMRFPDDYHESDDVLNDLKTQRCIRLVLSHLQMRLSFAAMCTPRAGAGAGAGTGTVRRSDEGDREVEPAAKRRR